MAGTPKPSFYVVLALVVAGLVAFAVFRSDLFAPKGSGGKPQPIDPAAIGAGGAEAADTQAVTTVKEYEFVPSQTLPPVKGTSAYRALEDDTIRFALDWTPNTNHTGLYVAMQEGLFDEAGLDVEILPYNNTTPDTLVDAGNAEFGISTQGMTTFARAAGSRTVSVLAPLQHWATGIAVKADRADLARPRDLDGHIYAGFGDPGDEETLRQVIRNDGGRGEFTSLGAGNPARSPWSHLRSAHR